LILFSFIVFPFFVSFAPHWNGYFELEEKKANTKENELRKFCK